MQFQNVYQIIVVQSKRRFDHSCPITQTPIAEGDPPVGGIVLYYGGSFQRAKLKLSLETSTIPKGRSPVTRRGNQSPSEGGGCLRLKTKPPQNEQNELNGF